MKFLFIILPTFMNTFNKKWEKTGTYQRDSLLTSTNTILTAQLEGKGTYSLPLPTKKLTTL